MSGAPKNAAGARGTTLEVIRGTYGALQLAAPGLLADRLLAQGLDRRGRGIARVLAARQLGQALASGSRPSYPVLALGVEVDLLHAASMLVLGLVNRRRRQVAITDALIASSFAVSGALAAPGAVIARIAARSSPGRATPSGRRGLREKWADRLARALVPGYPPERP